MSQGGEPGAEARQPDSTEKRATLWTLRGLWAVDLSLQVMLVVGLAVVIWVFGDRPAGATEPWLFAVAWGVLLVGVPIGLFTRNQIYKANWRGGAVTPKGYFLGYAAAILSLELATAVAWIVAALTWRPWLLLPAVASVLIYAVNFPMGGAMDDRPPRIGGASA